MHCNNKKCESYTTERVYKNNCRRYHNVEPCKNFKPPCNRIKPWGSNSACSDRLDGPLDTGDLVNDPLYIALDKLYERGWTDKHKKVNYDPRGTTEWQSVLDLFRLNQRRKTTMRPKKLENIRVIGLGEIFELIIDFDNDRHHALTIDKGDTKDEIVRKLRMFASRIECDKHLNT